MANSGPIPVATPSDAPCTILGVDAWAVQPTPIQPYVQWDGRGDRGRHGTRTWDEEGMG